MNLLLCYYAIGDREKQKRHFQRMTQLTCSTVEATHLMRDHSLQHGAQATHVETLLVTIQGYLNPCIEAYKH